MALQIGYSLIAYYLDGQRVEDHGLVGTGAVTASFSGSKVTLSNGDSYSYTETITNVYVGTVVDKTLPVYATSVQNKTYRNIVEVYVDDELFEQRYFYTESFHRWVTDVTYSDQTVTATTASGSITAIELNIDVKIASVTYDNSSSGLTPRSKIYVTSDKILDAPKVTVSYNGALMINGGNDSVKYWKVSSDSDQFATTFIEYFSTGSACDLHNSLTSPGAFWFEIAGYAEDQETRVTNISGPKVYVSNISFYLDYSLISSFLSYNAGSNYSTVGEVWRTDGDDTSITYRLLPSDAELSKTFSRPIESTITFDEDLINGYVDVYVTSQWMTKVMYYNPDGVGSLATTYYGSNYSTVISAWFENDSTSFNSFGYKIGDKSGNTQLEEINTDDFTISSIKCSSVENSSTKTTTVNLYINPSGDIEHTISVAYNGNNIVSSLHEYEDLTLTTSGKYLTSDIKLVWN